MTKDEFNEWLTYHGARFLGIGPWLTKANGKNGMPDRQDVLHAWSYVLRELTLDEAKKATDDLYCLPEDKQPRSFDRHPVAVRDLAGHRRRGERTAKWHPRFVDGIEVFDCLLCRDTGGVQVVHPQTISDVRAGRGPEMVAEPTKRPIYDAVAGCTCKHAQGMGWDVTYKEATFLPTPENWGWMSLAPKVACIQEWLATRKPAGYHDEFEKYACA